MKKKLNSKAQKQINQHIFKYVKSLTPYNPNPQASNIYDKIIVLKNIKKDQQIKRQPMMSLSSRVYQLTHHSPHKKQKRVKFALDLNQSQRSTLHNNKQSSISNDYKINNNEGQKQLISQSITYSTTQIKQDLQLLQKSIFNTFKIKKQMSSNYQSSYNYQYFKENTKYNNQKQQMEAIKRNWSTPHLKSHNLDNKSTISRLQIQSNRQSSSYRQNKSKGFMGSPLLQHQGELSKNTSFKGPFNKNPSKFVQQRSKIYLQQQNKLMVEIFRNKLRSKQKQ